MNKKNFKLLASFGVVFLAGAIGSLVTFWAIPTWYAAVRKPLFCLEDLFHTAFFQLFLVNCLFWPSLANFWLGGDCCDVGGDRGHD